MYSRKTKESIPMLDWRLQNEKHLLTEDVNKGFEFFVLMNIEIMIVINCRTK